MTRPSSFLALPTARRPQLRVPSLAAWPPAVVSAERLTGSLVRCGPGYRPIAWPDTPRVRLAVLGSLWLGMPPASLIAIGRTAAWVRGARAHPGAQIEYSTLARRRFTHATPAGTVVHEYSLEAGDVEWFDRVGVACAPRIICDMLRAAGDLDRTDRVACRLLLLSVPDGRVTIRRALHAGGRQHRRIALAKLESL